jgi:hypothetical protein
MEGAHEIGERREEGGLRKRERERCDPEDQECARRVRATGVCMDHALLFKDSMRSDAPPATEASEGAGSRARGYGDMRLTAACGVHLP